MKRVLVSLPEEVWKTIAEDLHGKMGDKDSEIIRNIVISFLAQQGYFANKGINEKLDTVDTMITSLAEVLEEKGQLDYPTWENRIRQKIGKKTSPMS